ncbi:MAG: MerR family transcriptional regulator [Lachnospiraceae bacterium]|nr:MerR family transcriptional regulator [Lachnospiraceae bacterium]
MKDYYKISEISKLYGIGTDSIRYYEKLGILKPRRDTNGYRLYNLKDMYKLNMIRDLRHLDFSMEQIKDYLDHQCVSNTLEMLHREQEYVKEQLKELCLRERFIHERILDISRSLEIKPDVFVVKKVTNRSCVRLSEHITRDEEMDFLVKKLEQKHEDKIRDFGNQAIGAFFDMDYLNQGRANVYQSIFFILEVKMREHDFMLPEGAYLSYYYRGKYKQNLKLVEKMFQYAKEKRLNHDGKPFELYHIDNRDTKREKEFLTEIQLRLL